MDHRGYVGHLELFDLMAAHQLATLVDHGARSTSHVLDLGAGCLRAGRLLLAWLEPGHYNALEPAKDVLEAGIDEVGRTWCKARGLNKSTNGEFDLAAGWSRKLEPIDYVLAQSVFSHAATHQIARTLETARGVLAPGGVIVASYHDVADRVGRRKRAEPYLGDDWVYPKCVFHPTGTIQQLASAAGYAVSFHGHTPEGQRWARFAPR